jgi:hypothetical protein
LPTPFEHSDLALLGYTGAYLPSDGFGLVPVFPTDSREPCDLVVEVAGLRHTFGGDPACIHVGDEIRLQADPQNPVDQDAVLVTWNGQRLGYINRALRDTFKAWISSRSVTATVDRVNGKPDRPLVYLRVAVR